MPHAISAAVDSPVNIITSETGQKLTESILTLQQTIRNIRDDVAAGIAPSIIMPSENVDKFLPENVASELNLHQANDLTSGMIMLSLEPSTQEINTSLTPLETRLQTCIGRLIEVSHWFPPSVPPKSPEYSIIDLNDLSGAIKIIEEVISYTWPAKPPTAHSFFKQYKWEWDPIWKEFYSKTAPAPLPQVLEQNQSQPVGGGNTPHEIENQTESYIYLSLWHMDSQRQRWVHCNMNLFGFDVTPESAAEYMGSWEDWRFDSRWKEWCVDIKSLGDADDRYVLYATRWHINRENQWVYG